MNSKLLVLIVCLITFNARSAEDKLFQSVFGNRLTESTIPVKLPTRSCGEVKGKLRGDILVELERQSLVKAMRACVKYKLWKHIKVMGDWVLLEDVNLPIRYNPQELAITVSVDPENESKQDRDITEHPNQIYADEALTPSPFGGAINYRLEQAYGDRRLGGKAFSAYLDSFINFHGLVLENQSNYLNDPSLGTGWFRGDTRLVKDFSKERIRAEAGDVYPANFGFMSARPIGGLHVARNYTLDPYRIPYPQGQGQFTLRTRSQVRTYVNGVLVKDEILPAGNYNLKDVPLINGLNTVIVEAIDELGERKTFEFKLPTSVGLLSEGQLNFSLSSGKPITDNTFQRQYGDDLLSSGFIQYGLTRSFSLGGYAQSQNDFQLYGTEAGLATNLGNFFLGGAISKEDINTAGASAATWQWQNLGVALFSSYTFTLRHERYGDGFRIQNAITPQRLRSQWQTNITVPIRETMTASLGSSWGEMRDKNLANRHGWDGAISLRALSNMNLSFFISRTRDEYKKWNDIAYVFFTWSFDGANHLVSGFHDLENKVTRVTGIRDNNNRLYDPRITATAEESEQRDSAEIDVNMPTPFAQLGARGTATRFAQDDHNVARGVVRLSQALVFAQEDGQWGFGLSRPVPNSFVLFKPSENLKDQKVSLRSTSHFVESASGPFGEMTYNYLIPYQFRELQLDPSELKEGTSLVQEKFIVYPTYRSAHLIPLDDRGSVILTGRLLDKSGKPIALRVGDVAGRPFFTTRDGTFYIDGLGSGTYHLRLEDNDAGIPIKIKKKERGIKKLGDIRYQLTESL